MNEAAKLTLRDALYANLFDGQRGGKVTMSVDDLVGEVVEVVADRFEELSDDRGPNERFQMYSREGNDAVAKMVGDLLARTETERWRRSEVVVWLKNAVTILALTHPEVHDTEPEWAIVDAVNARLTAHGFAKISREDLS